MTVRVIALCAGIVLAAMAAGAAKQEEPGYAQQVDKLVEQLGNGSVESRMGAEVLLWSMPPKALGAIEAASKRDNLKPQVRAVLVRVVERQKPLLAPRRAKLEARDALWRWNERTALAAYESAGKHSPKWDDAAREGIKLYVVPGSGAAALKPLEKAIDAGCDDPLVLYMEARRLDDVSHPDPSVLERLYRMAAEGMEKSSYPPSRRSFAMVRYCRFVLKHGDPQQPGAPVAPEAGQRLQRLTAAVGELWPQTTKEPRVPPQWLDEIGTTLIDVVGHTHADLKPAFDDLFDHFQKAFPHSPDPLVFKGKFYTTYAWKARGGGFADTVTEEGWKLMRERLDVAEEALTKAWEMDPTRPEAAVEMIGVELGQGKGRDVMETWYRRAMDADPDNLEAIRAKMYYLEPKWHGSAEDMLGFARELLAQKNYYCGFQRILADAHDTLATYAGDGDDYFHDPQVWADLKSVFLPELAAWPDDLGYRSRFAYYACRCGKWAEAKKQFDLLGDHALPSRFGGREAMENFQKMARDEANRAAP